MPFPQKEELKANSILAVVRSLNIQATVVFSFIQQPHLHFPLGFPSVRPWTPPGYEGRAAAITRMLKERYSS